MKLIIATIILLAGILAQRQHDAALIYDEEEHFKDIPDLVNMTQVRYRFQMAN
jgi:hypothetical protein